jgi:hypothetical protein
MMAIERQPAELRIDFRDERALMSRIAGVERDDAGRIAAFPRGLPGIDASARGGHKDNLTRRKKKWKQGGRRRYCGRSGAIVSGRMQPKKVIHTISCGFGTAPPPSVGSFRQINIFSSKRASGDFGRAWRVWGMLKVVHSLCVAQKIRKGQAEKFIPSLRPESWIPVRVGSME